MGPYDEACPVNTFIGAGAGNTCSACTAGNYCPVGSGVEVTCPQGYYCPAASEYPQKCPKGKYGASTGLAAESECTPCEAGKVCSQNGLQAPDGECDPGYFCDTGSSSPIGEICSPGMFCVKGTSAMEPCPAGKYNAFPGMRAGTDCIDCTAGFYC